MSLLYLFEIGTLKYEDIFKMFKDFRAKLNAVGHEVMIITSACQSGYIVKHESYIENPFPIITVNDLNDGATRLSTGRFPKYSSIMDILLRRIGLHNNMTWVLDETKVPTVVFFNSHLTLLPQLDYYTNNG